MVVEATHVGTYHMTASILNNIHIIIHVLAHFFLLLISVVVPIHIVIAQLGGGAQSAKRLQYKPRDLSLTPQHPWKSQAWKHMCNLSTVGQEERQGDAWSSLEASLAKQVGELQIQ